MISTRDILKRVGVGGSLVPFFKCVIVYFAVSGGSGGGVGGEGQAPGAGAALLKCAPVLCLLLAVALQRRSLPAPQARYGGRVCAGLALSAAGDAVLVWPGRAHLLGGMGAFAAAHLAYISAFGWVPVRARLGALWLAAAALYARTACAGAQGALAALVPAYAALLATMAWRAVVRGGPAAPGALSFLFSDAVLGYEMFAGPVPYRQVLVMATYYLGQLGIAASALPLSARG